MSIFKKHNNNNKIFKFDISKKLAKKLKKLKKLFKYQKLSK